MCGRFTRHSPWRAVWEMYRLTVADKGRNTQARYNIAPTEEVLFVTADPNGDQKLREGRWWLVPWFAKEMPKAPMFNVRSETAGEKAAFRDAFRNKRCLIPADGFFEWTRSVQDSGKDPWHIHLPDQQPFSFAGLWAYNHPLDITSCTILTAAARHPMQQLNDRQPIILNPLAYDAWLDPLTSLEDIKELLLHDLGGRLQFYRAGRQVNSTRGENHAAMIEPLNRA